MRWLNIIFWEARFHSNRSPIKKGNNTNSDEQPKGGDHLLTHMNPALGNGANGVPHV
jgi:hypothetical protein